MKTKILPMVCYGTALGTYARVLIAARKLLGLKPVVAVGAGWLISIIAALLVGFVAVGIKPDLRFSTKQQIDGLGYVHQPWEIVVYMTLLAVCLAVVSIFRR
jgi:hypothetical protein